MSTGLERAYESSISNSIPTASRAFSGLDIPFTIRLIEGINESYPSTLPLHQIPQYIAERKALAYQASLAEDEVVLTADTVVIVGDKVLGKPHSPEEARAMLHELSGHEHQVSTGVALMGPDGRGTSFVATTRVWFASLSEEQIDYYLRSYHPYDKAGAYGIQEWIGYVAIEKIEGSFYNVMGLPVHLVYQTLQKWQVCEKISYLCPPL